MMRIIHYQVYHYTLPLEPPLVLRGKTCKHRTGLLLRLTDADGYAAWGEAAPLPGFSRETEKDVIRELEKETFTAGEKLLQTRMNTSDLPETWETLSPSTRHALACAVWKLMIREQQFYHRFSDADLPGKTIPVAALVWPGASRDEDWERLKRLKTAGVTAVKMKVGRYAWQEEASRVLQLRQIMGDQVALRLDANRAWDYPTARAFLDTIAPCQPAYVEEPLRNPARLGELARETGLVMALDETLLKIHPRDLADWKGVGVLVLKPSLLGGPLAVMQFAQEARRLNMRLVLSAVFESGVGTADLITMASCLAPAPVGADTYHWLADDVLEDRLPLEPGMISVPAIRALGEQVRLDGLDLVAEGSRT